MQRGTQACAYYFSSLFLLDVTQLCVSVQELAYCQEVILAVHDDHGVRTIVTELLQACNNDATRAAAITLLRAYCEQTKSDLTQSVFELRYRV